MRLALGKQPAQSGQMRNAVNRVGRAEKSRRHAG